MWDVVQNKTVSLDTWYFLNQYLGHTINTKRKSKPCVCVFCLHMLPLTIVVVIFTKYNIWGEDKEDRWQMAVYFSLLHYVNV